MEFSIKSGSPEKQRTGCVVVGVFEGRKLTASAQTSTAPPRASSRKCCAAATTRARPARRCSCTRGRPAVATASCSSGLGKEREMGETAYRKAIDTAVKALKSTGATDATVLPHRPAAPQARHGLQGRAGGARDHRRALPLRPHEEQAARNRSGRCARSSCTSRAAATSPTRRGRRRPRARDRRAASHLARDLGNLPGQHLHADLSRRARRRSSRKHHGLECEILDQKDIEKLGMGAFLAVARGSRQPPKLIVLEHRGAKKDDAARGRSSARASPSTRAASRSSPPPRWTR